jgi:hypothetical protein
MTAKGICIVGLAATCIALLAVPAAAEPVRVWGTCSAAVSQNPRFQNEWEYTIDIGWDSTGWEPEHLEQVGLFLDLESCPCVGAPTFFAFPYTNGVGTGKDGGATRYYYSGYPLPEGSLRFATQGPAVVFEYIDTGSVLNVQGTARFVFVSTSRPGERRACPDGIGIAVGPNEARGEITGVFPSCDCGNTPVGPATTWGTIKAMFK